MKTQTQDHFFAEKTIFGARLKWWRGNQELSIEAAALMLGVSTATWGHWETGHTFPSGMMLLNVSHLTGLPLHLLFCPHYETCRAQTPDETAACCSEGKCGPADGGQDRS